MANNISEIIFCSIPTCEGICFPKRNADKTKIQYICRKCKRVEKEENIIKSSKSNPNPDGKTPIKITYPSEITPQSKSTIPIQERIISPQTKSNIASISETKKSISVEKPSPQVSAEVQSSSEVLKPTPSEVKDKNLTEDYEYPNKKASRIIIRDYLENLRKANLIKPFDQQKVLILTHIQAFDFKEVLLPLGYKKENIYIVEREHSVYNAICNDSFFKECKKFELDLLNFKSKVKFDLFYLDFKSNFFYGSIDILENLISHNATDGSIVYLNFQMAREIKPIVELYHNLEHQLMSIYDKNLEQQMKGILDYLNESDCNNNLIPNFLKEINFRDLLKNRNNLHLLRQKTIQLAVHSILDKFLVNYKEILRNFDKTKSLNLGFPMTEGDLLLEKDMTLTNRERQILALIRYMTNSLIMLCFKQFIYMNKNDTPFLSTLFLLKNEKSLLSNFGFRDFTDSFLEAFVSFYLRQKDLICDRELTTALSSYQYLEAPLHTRYLYPYSQTARIQISHSSKQIKSDLAKMDNELRETKNNLRHIYTDLLSHKAIKIDEDQKKLIFNLFYFFKPIIKEFNFAGIYKRCFDKGKKGFLDLSPSILTLHIGLKLLVYLESIFEKSIDISTCDIVDVENITNIEQYLIQKFDYAKDILVEIKSFKDEVMDVLDNSDDLTEELNGFCDEDAYTNCEELVKEFNNVYNCAYKRIFLTNDRKQKPLITNKESPIYQFIQVLKRQLRSMSYNEITEELIKSSIDGLNEKIKDFEALIDVAPLHNALHNLNPSQELCNLQKDAGFEGDVQAFHVGICDCKNSIVLLQSIMVRKGMFDADEREKIEKALDKIVIYRKILSEDHVPMIEQLMSLEQDFETKKYRKTSELVKVANTRLKGIHDLLLNNDLNMTEKIADFLDYLKEILGDNYIEQLEYQLPSHLKKEIISHLQTLETNRGKIKQDQFNQAFPFIRYLYEWILKRFNKSSEKMLPLTLQHYFDHKLLYEKAFDFLKAKTIDPTQFNTIMKDLIHALKLDFGVDYIRLFRDVLNPKTSPYVVQLFTESEQYLSKTNSTIPVEKIALLSIYLHYFIEFIANIYDQGKNDLTEAHMNQKIKNINENLIRFVEFLQSCFGLYFVNYMRLHLPANYKDRDKLLTVLQKLDDNYHMKKPLDTQEIDYIMPHLAYFKAFAKDHDGSIFDPIYDPSIEFQIDEIGEENQMSQKVDQISEDQMKEIINRFLIENPEKISKDIMGMVIKYIEETYGYTPQITECQVRAFRAWITMRNRKENLISNPSELNETEFDEMSGFNPS